MSIVPPPHATDDRFNADLIPDLKECNMILRESSALFQQTRAVATTVGGNIAFDICSDNEQSDALSPGDNSLTEHESIVKQMLTSPLKLFSRRKKTTPTPTILTNPKCLS